MPSGLTGDNLISQHGDRHRGLFADPFYMDFYGSMYNWYNKRGLTTSSTFFEVR
jgi:hypothetical protein